MSKKNLDFLKGLGQSKPTEQIGFSSLGEVLFRYGQLFVDATKRNLEQEGDNASYRLSESIAFDIDIIGLSYRFSIRMEDYWRYVDQGRKAGTAPPVKAIVEWIYNKPSLKASIGATRTGLKSMKMAKLGDLVAPAPILSAAFAIRNKIKKEGVKGDGFYSNVVNDQALIRLQRDLTEAIGKDVQITIKDIADSINKKD